MDNERLPTVELLNVDLERDGFLRDLLRELSGTLQDVVGIEEASGFISVVGQRIGENINASYRKALSVDNLTREQVGEVLVDLKKRIQGTFYIIEADDTKIVFGNNDCPFGDRVADRPALCMMTSNVFGSIAADNLGYARVDLEQTIAQGDGRCRVVVHLQPTKDSEVRDRGREYYRA